MNLGGSSNRVRNVLACLVAALVGCNPTASGGGSGDPDATAPDDVIAPVDGATPDAAPGPDATVAPDATVSPDAAGPDASVAPDGAVVDSGPPPVACPGVPITADGVLDLNLRAVRVRGAVTLNGGALPARDHGALVFVDARTRTQTAVSLGAASAYEVTLPPGTYDLRYRPAAGCTGATMPCSGGVIRAGVALTADGVLDVDLRGVRVRGGVTLNGAAMPDATASRGALVLSPADGEPATSLVPATGAAAYDVMLLAGTYSLAWQGVAARCADASAAIPCNGGVIRAGVALAADGVLDLDLRSVRVRGAVTLNGAAAPADARGALTFARADGTAAAVPVFGARGGTYTVTLVAGRYDVAWAGSGGACGPSGAPCNGASLRTGVMLSSDGALDLDVRSVRVRGALTLAGAPLPDATAARGALVFAPDGGGAASVAVSRAGAFTYDVVLSPGTYRVAWQGNAALCATAVSPVPCNGGALRAGVNLSADGVLDLDMRAVRVRGAVRVNGAAPATAGAALEFALGDDRYARLLGAGGAYDVTLLPGTYNLGWRGPAAACATTELPCNAAPLQANVMLTADGVLDLDARAVRVRGAVTLNGAALPESTMRGALRFQGPSPAVGGVDLALPSSGAGAYAVTLIAGAYTALHSGALACDATRPSTVPCGAQALAGCTAP